MSTRIKYLKKANDNAISFCSCGDGLSTYPSQASCPWCGCGWLHTCVTCRKAYTFAECVELETTYEEIGKKDLEALWKRDATEEEVAEWTKEMKILLAEVEVGKIYVIIDGKLIEADATNVEFQGWYAEHKFDKMPQTEAIDNFNAIHAELTQETYWKANKLNKEEPYSLKLMRKMNS